nr:MAG: hypothetical protein [Bacteriophage sp.]
MVELKKLYRTIFLSKNQKGAGEMARKYKRLSYEDRKTIEEMCRNGKKADEIAAAMDVHRATIYHELQRGGAGGGNRQQYSADMAQRAI